MTPTPASLTGWGEGSGHATGPLELGRVRQLVAGVHRPAGRRRAGGPALAGDDRVRPGRRERYPGRVRRLPAAGRDVHRAGAAGRPVRDRLRHGERDGHLVRDGPAARAAGRPRRRPSRRRTRRSSAYAGTGGGSPGSFNLTPGTVHVALTADQMTMAYLKDPWGVTLSTTVAGPYAGGSTAAVTQTGTYRLDVYGTGAWTAVVTWTGTPASGGPHGAHGAAGHHAHPVDRDGDTHDERDGAGRPVTGRLRRSLSHFFRPSPTRAEGPGRSSPRFRRRSPDRPAPAHVHFRPAFKRHKCPVGEISSSIAGAPVDRRDRP